MPDVVGGHRLAAPERFRYVLLYRLHASNTKPQSFCSRSIGTLHMKHMYCLHSLAGAFKPAASQVYVELGFRSCNSRLCTVAALLSVAHDGYGEVDRDIPGLSVVSLSPQSCRAIIG